VSAGVWSIFGVVVCAGNTGRLGDRRTGSVAFDGRCPGPSGLSLGLTGGRFFGNVGGSLVGFGCGEPPCGLSACGVIGVRVAGEGDRVRGGGGPAWGSDGLVMFSNLARSADTGLMEEPSGPSPGRRSMTACRRCSRNQRDVGREGGGVSLLAASSSSSSAVLRWSHPSQLANCIPNSVPVL
jgi:hypothetical protein